MKIILKNKEIDFSKMMEEVVETADAFKEEVKEEIKTHVDEETIKSTKETIKSTKETIKDVKEETKKQSHVIKVKVVGEMENIQDYLDVITEELMSYIENDEKDEKVDINGEDEKNDNIDFAVGMKNLTDEMLSTNGNTLILEDGRVFVNINDKIFEEHSVVFNNNDKPKVMYIEVGLNTFESDKLIQIIKNDKILWQKEV